MHKEVIGVGRVHGSHQTIGVCERSDDLGNHDGVLHGHIGLQTSYEASGLYQGHRHTVHLTQCIFRSVVFLRGQA